MFGKPLIIDGKPETSPLTKIVKSDLEEIDKASYGESYNKTVLQGDSVLIVEPDRQSNYGSPVYPSQVMVERPSNLTQPLLAESLKLR